MEATWQDPRWLAGAHEWIDTELVRLGMVRVGQIEQPHVYPWSTVLRVPTEAGPVWFKANYAPLVHEAALVELLAARRPDCVPPLLASDLGRGWMLMADAGEQLRARVISQGTLDDWFDVLPLYAGLQLDLEADVDELLALGVPDLRLATLPERYDRLMAHLDPAPRFRDAAPVIADLCRQLAAFGIAETLQHDDLHDGQVFVRDGELRLLDWGDACVSHPFFTLAVTLQGVLSWGLEDIEDSVDTSPFRDAYLAPYAERYDGDLLAASVLAMRLGWACRAVNGHVDGDDEKTITRLRMFLDGRA